MRVTTGRAFIFGIIMGTLLAVLASSCGNNSEFNGRSSKQVQKKQPVQTEDVRQEEPTEPVPPPPQASETPLGKHMVQVFVATEFVPADIVMAIDTSDSMKEEMVALEGNLKLFLDSLAAEKIDAQVTLIAKTSTATDTVYGKIFAVPKDMPADKFAVVDRYVHSTDAIGHLSAYFRGAYGQPLPLRDNSIIEAVIVSDDNGSNTENNPYNTIGNKADEFTPPAGRHVTVNAVVGSDQSVESATCQVYNVGTEHMALQEATGGTYIDICTQDWGALVTQLSKNIAARRLAYTLSNTPDMALEVVVTVDGNVVDPKFYTIDASTKTLKFDPDYTLSPESEVKVAYYYTET